jgi:hypothetical protein
MRITQALRGEHGAITPLLDFAEKSLSSESMEGLKLEAQMLTATLMTHAGIEDDVLVPSIREYLPPPDVPTDHERLAALLKQVADATDMREARRLLGEAIAETRKHFAKEEERIFLIAERELPVAAQHALGDEWAARRGVVIGQSVGSADQERLKRPVRRAT